MGATMGAYFGDGMQRLDWDCVDGVERLNTSPSVAFIVTVLEHNTHSRISPQPSLSQTSPPSPSPSPPSASFPPLNTPNLPLAQPQRPTPKSPHPGPIHTSLPPPLLPPSPLRLEPLQHNPTLLRLPSPLLLPPRALRYNTLSMREGHLHLRVRGSAFGAEGGEADVQGFEAGFSCCGRG